MKKLLSITLFLLFFSARALAADYYMDYQNGSDSNNGSSWGSAWKTFANTATMNPGDRLKIAKSSDPVSLGNATWTYGQKEITLNQALTSTIDNCESGWVAAPNVTLNHTSTYRKEGTYNVQADVQSAFTTGKIAYKTITSADFSGFNTISFWIRTNAIVNANYLRVVLCSDTTGDVIVNSAVINWQLQYYDDYRVSINTGASLGSSIQSVAIYADTDPGTVSIYLDNIFAANNFHLRSLISKNTSGLDKIWYVPEYINGVVVGLYRLDANTRYAGISETVTTYYRNPIYLPVSQHYDNIGRFEFLDSGTSGSPMTISGGWNTSTDLRDGETFFMGQNASYYKGIDGIFYAYQKNYLVYENLGAFESYYNFNFYDLRYYIKIQNCWAGGYWGRGFWIETYSPGFTCDLDYLYVTNDRVTSYGFYLDIQDNDFSESYDTTLDNLYASGCYLPFYTLGYTRKLTLQNSNFSGNQYGLRVDTWLDCVVNNVTCKKNYINLYISNWNRGNVIKNSTFTDYTSYNFGFSYYASAYLTDCMVSDGRAAQSDGNKIVGSYTDSPRFFISKCDKQSNYTGWITDQVTAGYTAGDARGGSGYCVVMDPFWNVSGRTLDLVIAIPVTQNQAFTFSFYHKVTNSFNGSLTFSAEGAGITPIQDSSVILTADGNWHEYISSQMTPSGDGWIKITLKALDGAVTGSIFLDDFKISSGADKELGTITGGFPMFEYDLLITEAGFVTTAFTYTE